MAIRLITIGATELRPASVVYKKDYRTAITAGGASGQVVGGYVAAMVRLPATFTGNQGYNLYGSDVNENGAGNETNETTMTIGGPTFSTTSQRRLFRYRFSTLQLDPSGMSQAGDGSSHLVIAGTVNTGTNASPVWRQFLAIIPLDGTSAPQTGVFANNTTFTNSNVWAVFSNLFFAAGTALPRTPIGFALENFAYVEGDFPWDTANNPTIGTTGVGRPSHEALQALGGQGANPFLTYETLIAAQNAGTLPYANLRSNGDAVDPRPGRANLSYWYKLASLSDLANYGTAGANALSQVNYNSLSGGLEAVTNFSPAHWQSQAPTINDYSLKFHGGRGARALTVAGGCASGTTTLQRRWVVEATGNVFDGRDWGGTLTVSGTTWTLTETLPVTLNGPIRLEVRDPAAPSLVGESAGWLVGTVMLNHGQSGSQIWMTSGNQLGIVVATGAQGLFMNHSPADAGGGSYVQPVMAQQRLVSGATPSGVAGQGAILCLNEWNVHNPGHPLMMANMSIPGTTMANWAANGGYGQWTFMGSVGNPGAGSAGGVGVVGHFAWAMNSYVDIHVMHWTPNMADDQATRDAYVAAVNARFTTSAATALWLTTPCWRQHDANVSFNKRAAHVSFNAERGALGVLGPYWPDILSGQSGALHPAIAGTPGSGDNTLVDTNQIGGARLGRGYGRSLAWAYDRTVKAHGPRVVAGWTDNACVTVNMEVGRVVRTLNGAAISAGQFWISTNGGSTWTNSGFTVALDASATRAVLTPSDAAAWETARAAGNLRLDYARFWPFTESSVANEADNERNFDGLLYDDQTYRGGVNFAAGLRAGNPLASANGNGVAVTVRGSAKLYATERWTGTRNVTVQMIAADGVTVLREKTLAITGS